MSHCLYCDRPLALLKRLTGEGGFCSKEHKKLYQSEHNKLGVQRLLAAKPAMGKPRLTIVEAVLPDPVVDGPPLAGYAKEYPFEATPISGALEYRGDPLFARIIPAWWMAPPPKLAAGEFALDRPEPRAWLFQAEPLDPKPFEGLPRIPRRLAQAPLFAPMLAEALATKGIKLRSQDPERAGFVPDMFATLAPPRGSLKLDGAFRAFPASPARPRQSRWASPRPGFARFVVEPPQPRAVAPAAPRIEVQPRRAPVHPAIPASGARPGSPTPGRAGFVFAPPVGSVSAPAPRPSDAQLRPVSAPVLAASRRGVEKKKPVEQTRVGSTPECAGFLVTPLAPPVSTPAPRPGPESRFRVPPSLRFGGSKNGCSAGPDRAGFVVRPPAPSHASPAPRTPAGAQFRFTADASALLGGSRKRHRIVEPDRAGFLVQPPAAPVFAPALQAGGDARFHFAPVYAAYRNGLQTSLRPAVFLAEAAPPETGSGVPRGAAVSQCSFALLPALPDRPVARIVMVMGSFLHRGPRPVPQDRIRERFELPLRPVSFPPATPRMAFLEGRLHRTDRIGFTPP